MNQEFQINIVKALKVITDISCCSFVKISFLKRDFQRMAVILSFWFEFIFTKILQTLFVITSSYFFSVRSRQPSFFVAQFFPSSKKCNPVAYRFCQLYENITENVKIESKHAFRLLLQKVNYWHANSNYYTINQK